MEFAFKNVYPDLKHNHTIMSYTVTVPSPQQNGMLSALPYIGCGLLAVLGGQVADYLRESCMYPTVAVRKAFSIAGEAGDITAHITQHLEEWLGIIIWE